MSGFGAGKLSIDLSFLLFGIVSRQLKHILGLANQSARAS